MDPLLPRDLKLDDVLAKAHDLRTEAARLSGACQAGVASELAALLRSMNSYYSNKIEGQHTRPLDVERALRADFSADADKARLQRLALAHIHTERWIQDTPQDLAQLYSQQGIARIHAHLFGQLDLADRSTVAKDGPEMLVTEPGQLRGREVAVWRHAAPTFHAIEPMLERWAQVYGGVRRGEMQIVALAAAHHRLLWIHPFLDGNGRAARLHTLAVLKALDLTQGLWSPLRGLARGAAAYTEKLSNADMPRMGDLDGRGPLSEQRLLEWIDHFIEVCLDQVRFMSGMLHMAAMEDRIAALLAHEHHVLKSGVRPEARIPLHYLFATQGQLDRGTFAAMTGLGERTASGLIARLLERGLLRSDSPRGPLRFGVPMHGLRLLFPNLWPEAEADVLNGAA
jgi:Fic family protein